MTTAYSVYVNLRRERHGPLVGRYKAKPVEGDSYHLSLSRYVHLNPIRTQAAKRLSVGEPLTRLRNYHWSSYQAYAGLKRMALYVARNIKRHSGQALQLAIRCVSFGL